MTKMGHLLPPHIFLVIIAALSHGCSNVKTEEKVVRFKQNVAVTEHGQKKMLKANETIVLGDGPVLVESPGRLGLLLVPMGYPPGSMDVELADMNSIELDELQKGLINRSLDRLMERIYEVQLLLSTKKGPAALEKLKSLKADFPKVHYLSYLEASILFVLGRYDDSKAALEEVQAESGQNERGKALYLMLNKALAPKARGKGGK